MIIAVIEAKGSGRLYAHELSGPCFWKRVRGRVQKAFDWFLDDLYHWHIGD